jgi:hypothetical protein
MTAPRIVANGRARSFLTGTIDRAASESAVHDGARYPEHLPTLVGR